MGLSSSVFWHQTSFDGASAILEGRKLLYSYSLETFSCLNTKNGSHSTFQAAFPMISFFNLPMMDLESFLVKTTIEKRPLLDKETGNQVFEQHHITTADGKYGGVILGFKHQWGEFLGLSPVWYRDYFSSSLWSLMASIDDCSLRGIENERYQQLVWNNMAYTKNFVGSLNKYNLSEYRFYDEHEWRVVPNLEDLLAHGIQPYLDEKEYQEYKKTHENSSLIPQLGVTFKWDDIEYIFYSNELIINTILSEVMPQKYLQKIQLMSYKQLLEDCIGVKHHRDDFYEML